jgi:anti-sigma B factor antagonist
MNEKKYETFAVQHQKDFAVIAIREKRIYMQLAEKFKEEISDFLENGEQNIIIDLSDVSVMNSAALGVLIALQNDLENKKGKLSIVGLQPLMEEIFYRMRLELLFNIDYSVDTALQKHAGQ